METLTGSSSESSKTNGIKQKQKINSKHISFNFKSVTFLDAVLQESTREQARFQRRAAEGRQKRDRVADGVQ